MKRRAELSDTPLMAKRLTGKQLAFVDQYFICNWNATAAARAAGYSEKTARLAGHRLITNDNVAAAIAERIKARRISADEVIDRLAEQARSDMDDFITGHDIDLDKARARRKMWLVKKFSRNDTEKSHHISIELHDAQAALVQLGKHLKLFTDKVEFGLTVEEWEQKYGGG